MSMELVQRALADIQQREAKEAETRAKELDERLGFRSEQEMLRSQAQEFLRVVDQNRADSRRGWFSRLFKDTVQLRTESYTDYTEADFLTPLEDWAKQLIGDKRPVYKESGSVRRYLAMSN